MYDRSLNITTRFEVDGRTIEQSIDISPVGADLLQAKAIPVLSDTSIESPGEYTDWEARIYRRGYRDAQAGVAPVAGEQSDPWTKVLLDGTRVPGSDPRTDHVAVIHEGTGLMWAVESLGDEDAPDDGIAQDHCIQRCKDLRLLGFDDWQLPTRAQLASLIDDTCHEPAIDTNLFPRVKPRWHWTSTPAAWSSASAWSVYFYYGGVYDYHRLNDGFALAVRRAGQ